MGQYLDTRDLVKRLDDLKSDRDDLQEKIDELETEISENENGLPTEEQAEDLKSAQKELEDFDESEKGDELRELEEMENEVSEWNDGNTLIPEEDFVEYVEDMLKDIGDLPKDIPWYIEIDWEKTADNIKADYSECEYQGVTYLYRVS